MPGTSLPNLTLPRAYVIIHARIYAQGEFLMAGQFDDLVGELSPGDHGWLPLDEAGNPTGPATLQPPPPPALACAVRVTAEVPLPDGYDLLVSETGAPLVPPLTSNVDKRDPDTYVAPVKPTITSLTPNTAVS